MSAQLPRLTHDQLAGAMLAAVRANATAIQEAGDRVDFNAWWRGGDGLKVAIWPARAAWADVKTGESGGAADFARVALGCSLREMLSRWGNLPPPAPAAPSAPRVAPPPVVEDQVPQDTGWIPGGARDVWEAHVEALSYCGGCPACVDGVGECPRITALEPVRAWLWEKRGIPRDRRIESGLLPVMPEMFPAGAPREWVERTVRQLGRAFLVPLRDRTNRVEGLVLRFPDQTDPARKTLNVRGLRRTADQGPVGFGWPGAAVRADLVVLVEGAPDTWAAEALSPPHAACVGCNGIGTLPRWVDHLSARRLPTILVPQLDPPHADPRVSRLSQRVNGEVAAQLARHGVPVTVFRWGAFLEDLQVLGVDTGNIKDVADACRQAKQASLAFAFVQDLFWAAARPGDGA